jgi:SAM-dependent methyltransferase
VGFEDVKARQSVVWGCAPWERVAETLAPLHDHLVAELTPDPEQRWLDVATGTGAVAIRAARAGADVTGLDLAPRLIETARRLAADEGHAIRFDVGDCEDLPYEDSTFDVVSSAVGVMFSPDHHAVARELARVCRPGGRLGLAAWRPNPDYEAVMAPFREPPEPGVGDPGDWGREEYVRQILAADFELQIVEGDCPVTGESAEAVWELWSTSAGPLKALVESFEPGRREKLRLAYVGYLERYRTNGGVRAPAQYLLVLGRRR